MLFPYKQSAAILTLSTLMVLKKKRNQKILGQDQSIIGKKKSQAVECRALIRSVRCKY